MSAVTHARWPWIVLVALLAGGLAVAALGDDGARTAEERARGIAESIACPVCAGQSVADSNVASAKNIRGEIVRRIEAGETDGEIRDAIAATYGDDLLLTPPRTGVGGLVWFLPVALFVGAVGGLAGAFRHWRVADGTEVSDDDRILVEQARRR